MSQLDGVDPEAPQRSWEDRSFSTLRANLGAIATVGPFVAGAVLTFVLVHGWQSLLRPLANASPVGTAIVLFGGILLHELLHLAAWKVAANPPAGSLKLGFMWKSLTPYAHCSVAMPVGAYIFGAAAPGVTLGLIPALVGIVHGSGGWMAFGVIFTLAAGGDALIIWLLRDVARDRMVVDHPTRPGCLLLPPGEQDLQGP